MLVTADNAVVVVSPKADGVQLVQTPTSNGSEEYTVTFSDVAVAESDVLVGAYGATGSTSWRWRPSAPTPTGWWPGRCA